MPLACASVTPVRLQPFCFAGGPAPRPRGSSKRYTDDDLLRMIGMKKIKANQVFGLLAIIAIVACDKKEAALLDFRIKDYLDAKNELRSEFGPPDSLVALCGKDSSYLYKVKNGCIEWRFFEDKASLFSVRKLSVCTIPEAEIVQFQADASTHSMHTWNLQLDSILAKDSDQSPS